MKEAKDKREMVMFGSYKGQDIVWIVLAEEEGKKLLVSRDALDVKGYHDQHEPVSWEKCSLRRWLNSEFYQEAFSQEEKGKICLSKVTADGNPQWDVDSGNDTEDFVFLLSVKEAEKYFDSNKERICRPSKYALDQGAWCCFDVKDYYGTCNWWLRTSGYAPKSEGYVAARVHYTGDVRSCGTGNDRNDHCVRPALWIKTK